MKNYESIERKTVNPRYQVGWHPVSAQGSWLTFVIKAKAHKPYAGLYVTEFEQQLASKLAAALANIDSQSGMLSEAAEDNVGKWRHVLSPEQIYSFDRIAGATLASCVARADNRSAGRLIIVKACLPAIYRTTHRPHQGAALRHPQTTGVSGHTPPEKAAKAGSENHAQRVGEQIETRHMTARHQALAKFQRGAVKHNPQTYERNMTLQRFHAQSEHREYQVGEHMSQLVVTHRRAIAGGTQGEVGNHTTVGDRHQYANAILS
ncbi:MAG: hypothetical protein AAGA91_12625 [Pseudomonadota bacterium]